MILLLGGNGYIGQAFQVELKRRHKPFLSVARKDLNYAQFDSLREFLGVHKPELVVNAAGVTGRPNVDACELARAETLAGNTLLPQTIAHACSVWRIPWGHISSGCIYAGAKLRRGATTQVVKDLTTPELRTATVTSPELILGFSEMDQPNFTFRAGPCSFYSGAKALGEEALAGTGPGYVWRLRIPFDEFDGARNYLSKVQRYAKVYDNVNSLSHRADFAAACLDLWEKRAAFGVYNVTNPGFVTARQVIALIEKWLKPKRQFEFWVNDAEFYRDVARAPRSNCVLDVTKLLAAGVRIRPVLEALEHSLRHWQPERMEENPQI